MQHGRRSNRFPRWPGCVTPQTLAESQRVRTAVLSQRAQIEWAWGRIEFLSDQMVPGRLMLRTVRGHSLLFGLEGDELWVEAEQG